MHLARTQASVGNQASRNARLAVKHPTRPAAHTVAEAAYKAVRKPLAGGALLAGLLTLAGCGNNYRPVISAISPVGPATLPQKYAVAISNPGPNLPGLATFVDFSGDSIVITANIGVNPQYLILGSSGSEAFTINGDGTLSSFAVTPSLLTSQVAETTLPPNSILPTSIFPEGTSTYVTQPGPTALVGQFTGTPPALQQEISSIGPNPVFIAGIPSAPRVYVISRGPLDTNGNATGPGTVAALNTLTNSVDSTIPVGTNPVYGVMTATAQRAFILNQGSNNIHVINAQQNTLDTGTPPVPPAVAPAPGNGIIADPTAVAPVWADLAPTLNQLVVVNQGPTGGNGSVSIFSIPLCSVGALASNPNCNLNNPVDAAGFGTLVAHIPVGKNPAMVAVLQDGSQAFVINEGDSTVSAINLTTDTVTATIPIPATPNPTFLAATTGTPLGKVYVTSTTSPTMTILRTDNDTVDTTIDLQGVGVQVRVTAP